MAKATVRSSARPTGAAAPRGRRPRPSKKTAPASRSKAAKARKLAPGAPSTTDSSIEASTSTDRSPSRRSFVLGGYDAKSCPTLVMKNHHADYSDEDKDPLPPGDVARMEAGVVFEAELGAQWVSLLGERLFAVPACDRSDRSKRRREQVTVALMQEPGDVRVIWNARLPQDRVRHRTGEPDALVWAGLVDGVHRWFPVDAKHHRSLSGKSRPASWPVSSLQDPFFESAVPVVAEGSPRREDALQLAHYHRMLESLGHAAPVPVGGIIGKDAAILWHRLDAATLDYRKATPLGVYDAEFADRVRIVSAALKGEETAPPEWKSECLSCVWRTSCHDELSVNLDHITLLPGITPERARAHYAAGVTRIADLAHLDWPTARLVDAGADVSAIKAWASTVPAETPLVTCPSGLGAALEEGILPRLGLLCAADALALDDATARYCGSKVSNLAGSIDLARARKLGKVYLARDVVSVGINRSVYEQDVDIEDADGFVYLIGVRTTGRKSDSGRTATERKRGEGRFEYDAFVTWERTPEAEAKVFADFWAHIQTARAYAKAKGYAWRLYYYTHHEIAAFRRLAERHAGRPGVPTVTEVDDLFALREVIDLYRVLVQQLVWPTESVKLKEVAKWVRFSWRDSDPSGSNSLAWYADAISAADETVREDNRQRLLDYNEDDVTAQVAIRDWLSRLGEARHPGKRLPSIGSLDRRFRRR